MHDELKKGLLISDFNVENLSAYLRNDRSEPRVDVSVSPFGQVVQTLLDESLPCWDAKPDFVVVWTRPETALESFRSLLAFSDVDSKDLFAEVDKYAAHLLAAKDRTRVMFAPSWVMPESRRASIEGVGVMRVQIVRGLTTVQSTIPPGVFLQGKAAACGPRRAGA